jgi:plastocyanin
MRALLLCSTLLGLMQGFLAVGALAGEVVKVSIGDLAFAPANITVRVGDTIEWNNTDLVDHTATAKNGDWGVDIAAGKSGRMELHRAGTIAYYCRFHPHMTGMINVVAAEQPQ